MEAGKGQSFALKELLEMIHSSIHSFGEGDSELWKRISKG